jgi:hypothetical protein
MFHLLPGSASNVVRTGQSVNGKMPKWTPIGPTPLHRSKPNSAPFIKFRGTPQLIKGARPTKGQHKSFVLVFSFLVCSFLVTTPSKNGSADFDDIYVKQRGFAQGSAFRGYLRLQEFPRGSLSPKPPKNSTGVRVKP